MKYYELVLKKDDEEIIYKLRLTSSNSVALEQKIGKSILDFVQDISITNVCRLLEYMAKDTDHNFGQKESFELYDILVNNGYTLYDIVYKVIYEVLVISGFLTKGELEEMVKEVNKSREYLKQEVQKML